MPDVKPHLPVHSLGLDTVMFTVSVDSIALMPCNPNVGGSSKGSSGKRTGCTRWRNG